MEEPHRIAERVFDEHTFGISGDDCLGGGFGIVGEQDCGLVMAEIRDEELAQVALVRTSRLLVVARGAVLAAGDLEFDGAPGRRPKAVDFGAKAF